MTCLVIKKSSVMVGANTNYGSFAEAGVYSTTIHVLSFESRSNLRTHKEVT